MRPIRSKKANDLFMLAIFAAIFAAISSAISTRPCKLLAIPQRFESPVVYTPRNSAGKIAAKIAAKVTSVNGP